MHHSDILLLFALITLLNGAFCASEKKNSTDFGSQTILSCIDNMKNIGEKVELIQVSNKSSTKEFLGYCGKYRKCLPFFRTIPNMERNLEIISKYCNAVQYLTVDFAECDSKLEEKKPACMETWEPFPNTKKIKIEETKAKMVLKACNSFFGEGNCMKTEITETCGKDKWEGFKKHYIHINDIVQQCEYKTLNNLS